MMPSVIYRVPFQESRGLMGYTMLQYEGDFGGRRKDRLAK